MNGDFVTYELAVKLKEKGFMEPCVSFYALENFTAEYVDSCGDCYEVDFEKGILYLNYPLRYNKFEEKMLPAPTISQVLKWLRNTRKLFISPCVITDYQDDFHRDTTYWSFIVVNIESGDSIYREYERVTEKRYETYEEAALAGIEFVLDNLI